MLDREGEQFVRAAQLEFGADVLAVRFHCGCAKEKFLGDFLRRFAQRDEPQYTPLGRRQRIQPAHLLTEPGVGYRLKTDE